MSVCTHFAFGWNCDLLLRKPSQNRRCEMPLEFKSLEAPEAPRKDLGAVLELERREGSDELVACQSRLENV